MKLVRKVIIGAFILLFSCGMSLPASASMEWIESEQKPTFKVVFLGDPEVGKTSLLKRLFNDSSNSDDLAQYLESFRGFNILYCDTSGQEQCESYIKDASIAVIVVDIDDAINGKIDAFKNWLDYFYSHNVDNIDQDKIRVILVISKADKDISHLAIEKLCLFFRECQKHFKNLKYVSTSVSDERYHEIIDGLLTDIHCLCGELKFGEINQIRYSTEFKSL